MDYCGPQLHQRVSGIINVSEFISDSLAFIRIWIPKCSHTLINLGDFSNDDGDRNENVKNNKHAKQ